MIEEIGKVVSVSRDCNQICIETVAKSACGSCPENKSCGVSALSKMFSRKNTTFWLPNAVGASVGDNVVVAIEERALVQSALLIYVMPLISLLVGAILADQLIRSVSEWQIILAGIAGLLSGLALVKKMASGQSVKSRLHPVVLRKANSIRMDKLITPHL